MILFEKSYDPTLDVLTSTLEGREIKIWSFDDHQTRRDAEARFAARGISAKCFSAYKPLVCAFLEEVDTTELVSAVVAYPVHPSADARRFLLESYPLGGLLPGVDLRFVAKDLADTLPIYTADLLYADGRHMTIVVPAPNHVHTDYSGAPVLSPCGWLDIDGTAVRLETDYEQLFHQTMGAIIAHPWAREPYFQELNISVDCRSRDVPLPFGDEVLSLTEALHEDFYFSLLEHFQQISGRPTGARDLRPGQIVPEIRQGASLSVRVTLRDWDRDSASSHREPLDRATRALSEAQIQAELEAIGGQTFSARSVAGRVIEARHIAGADRGVMISAGQHANETSGPIGALRAGKCLKQKAGANFTLSPLENPDGYALHQRLIRDNPRHMHHAARYTALGDDLEYRSGPESFEKAIRYAAEDRVNPYLHLNLHGYPAHEWTRPLSGYIPRSFAMWTIPKGFFLILRYRQGWGEPSRLLMSQVTQALNEVPGLRAFNEAQIALFECHAGETGFKILNGFPVLISEDERHSVPMTLITEYPDETIYAEALIAGHEAQMATVLAAYDALQQLPAELLPERSLTS